MSDIEATVSEKEAGTGAKFVCAKCASGNVKQRFSFGNFVKNVFGAGSEAGGCCSGGCCDDTKRHDSEASKKNDCCGGKSDDCCGGKSAGGCCGK
jgi:hypothetical protein